MSNWSSEVAPRPGDGLEATAELWSRLARPFDPAGTAEALLGLPHDVVTHLVGVLLATCSEAEALMAAMPATLRNLKSSTSANHERCVGELRGPIQWSESIAAQASSLGSTNVYVCAAPHRAYDIEENQVLIAALRAVAEGGRLVESLTEQGPPDEGLLRARDNARAARRYLDHRALSQVHLSGRPSARAINRTRRGKSGHIYGPALEMIARVAEPLTLEELAPYCDRRTRSQHFLVVSVIRELERRGLRVPAIRSEGGSLFAGPIEYRHPRQRGNRTRVHGVIIGHLLVDIPARVGEGDRAEAHRELEQRSGGRPIAMVMDPSDIPRIVDLAITTART